MVITRVDLWRQVWVMGLLVVCYFLVGGVPLYAQGVSTTTVATTSTTTLVADEAWYTSEIISGNNLEVTVKPGETVTKNIMVTNRISNDRRFTLSVEDMSGSADGSQSVVLLGDVSGPYTLRDYISFPETVFDLALGERATIPVTISMPQNAEPGGYYGGVLVSTIRDDEIEETVGAAKSPILARIGTLFFITVPGDAEVQGELLSVATIGNGSWYQSGPFDLGILFENTGSVHLNPHGEIRITNMLGEEVGFLPLEPWFVLPKSLRLREVQWDRELLLGRYTITARINRGYDTIIDEKVTHIWVLPGRFIAILFGGFFVFIFMIRFFLRTFELKRKR
jgi:hypothetical protein